MDFTKDQILMHINNAAAHSEPVRFDFKDIQMTFGFSRMDGKEIALRQILSSKTETELQMAPPYQIHRSIEQWSRENGIYCEYDLQRDYYIFRKKL